MGQIVYSFRPQTKNSSHKYEINVEKSFTQDGSERFFPYIEEYYLNPREQLGETRFIVWSGWLMDDKMRAKDLAVQNYHLITGDLKDAINKETVNVDTELLVVHPKNSVIYPSDSYEDLVRLLDRPTKERVIVKLLVNSLGIVVSGNRRTIASRIINNQHIKRNGRRLITDFPCDVKQFHSIVSEVKHLLVRNQYRQLSEEQVVRSLKILIKLEKAKTTQLLSNGEKSVGSTQKAAANAGKPFGFSASMVTAKIELDEKLKHLTELSPPLAEKMYQLREKLPTHSLLTILNNARDEVKEGVINEIHQQVVEEGGSKPSIKKLIARHTHNFERQRVQKAIEAGQKVISKEQILARNIEIADNMGEKFDDCLLTPKEQVYSVLEFMNLDKVTLDPFAEMERQNIPSENYYTIIEDGLNKPWFGKVFTTPPPSKVLDSLKKLSEEIDRGEIEEALLFLPSEKLYNKTSASIISKQDLVTLQFSNRFTYVASQFMRAKNPASTTKKYTQCITGLYYGNRANKFVNFFKGQGLALFSSIGRMTSIAWRDEGDFLVAEWFGHNIKISLNDKGLYVPTVSNIKYTEFVAGTLKDAKIFATAIIIDLLTTDDWIDEDIFGREISTNYS